jgi:hypothetical protein
VFATVLSCSSAFAGTIHHLSRMEVGPGDVSLAGARFSAIKEGALCLFTYEDEPFQIVEEGCIEPGEYQFNSSSLSDSGEQLAITRFDQVSGEGSLVVYGTSSDADRYEELWSASLGMSGPQIATFWIVGWVTDSALLVSTGCGSSCVAVSVATSDKYISERVALASDHSFQWSKANSALHGIGRDGRIFRLEVDSIDSERPGLSYAEYLGACLDDTGWYRAEERRSWQRFEAQIDADRVLLSKQPCNSGVAFNFANQENSVASRDLDIVGQVSVGSPLSVSHDQQRIASIVGMDGNYYLNISTTNGLSSIAKVELANFRPEPNSIENSYEAHMPVWSPDDSFILVPKSSISGGAIVIDAGNPLGPAIEMPGNAGRFGFYWLSNDKFIAKNLTELNIYEVIR